MKSYFKKHTTLILAMSMLMAPCLSSCDGAGKENSDGSTSENGNTASACPGKMVVRGYDFGPSVEKVIIDIPDEKKDALTADMFSVKEEKKDGSSSYSDERKVKDAFYSDAEGKKVDLSSYKENLYLTVELQDHPDEGLLLYFDNYTSSNHWFSDYSVTVLQSGEVLSYVTEMDFPELNRVDTKGSFTGSEGHTFSYAAFEPENATAENKRPLVIWLHGGGEGGTDPTTTVYGNEVVALFRDDFQTVMDGAYVLVPQCPTAWIEFADNGKNWNENAGCDSIYVNDLMELIEEFADTHHVDKERIMLGGCSNGGYMTIDLLMNYPGKFSAAYPICEILDPEGLPEDRINALKDVPMWFVYAENDKTVIPAVYEEPLIARLKEAGAKDLHSSVFQDVHDTKGYLQEDGQPYQYYGHFSWIYFFNDECTDGSLSLWQWLSDK